MNVSIKKIQKSCEMVCQILKALSHPQRLIILSHLLNQERSVSELVDLCDISQSQISQFLTRMKIEKLVQSRREGRFLYYSVADKRITQLMKTIQAEYCNC